MRLVAFLLPAVLGTACFLGGSPSDNPDSGLPPTDDGGSQAFLADSPFVYVAKVKDILTGLAPTEVEVDSVLNAQGDAGKRAALVTLIDAWMATPQYSAKMLGFFERAFQQTQISTADFMDLIPGNGMLGMNAYANNLLGNIRESFARTMLELVVEGRPLHEAFTTNRFMMTPALMELYGYLDQSQAQDNESVIDKFAMANPTLTITLEDSTAIPPSQSADPKNANYMHWYYPGLATIYNPVTACDAHQRDFPARAHTLHNLMYGGVEGGTVGGVNCTNAGGLTASGQLGAADFTTWKMITIRLPKTGEQTTAFWDANALRSASELVLTTPRVGFFSTPAFHANWPTNTSNQMRVTINQAFIVALGAQVDGTDPTDPGTNPPGLDSTHTSGGAECVGCHRILDPSRSILQATYSYGYGQQGTPALQSQKGWFVFHNVVNQNIQTVSDFGGALAAHPLFAGAWVQKLCFYANSRACAADDPELATIENHFKSSGYQWKTLVEDLLSSPITTNAVSSTTATELGEVVSVARRDHLCTLLDARLGLTDACGLLSISSFPALGIPEIAAGMPSDGYGRGAPIPVLPSQPTLFYRAGLENICEDVANMIIDNKSPPIGAVTFTSTSQAHVDAAIDAMVTNLMGIVPNDPRTIAMGGLLHEHYTAAIAKKAVPSDALKSTFISACLSPTVTGIGM